MQGLALVGGALLLLLMITRKKKGAAPPAGGGGGELPGGGDPNKVPVGDPKAGVHSGGTPAARGNGPQQSEYNPPSNLAATDVWIAPDCGAVLEGDLWFQERLLPRFVTIGNNWNRDWAPGVEDLLGMALGQITFSVDVDPLLERGAEASCLVGWPDFYWQTVYNRLRTENDFARLEADRAAYNEEFAVGAWLSGLSERLYATPAAFAALLAAQPIEQHVLYVTGTDVELVNDIYDYLGGIAGGRTFGYVDIAQMNALYPESFQDKLGAPAMIFMMTPEFQFTGNVISAFDPGSLLPIVNQITQTGGGWA